MRFLSPLSDVPIDSKPGLCRKALSLSHEAQGMVVHSLDDISAFIMALILVIPTILKQGLNAMRSVQLYPIANARDVLPRK